MKKGLLVLFLVVLSVSMAFANGGSDETAPMEDGELTITMMYSDNANYAYDPNWYVWDAIKENTGATFDIIAVPESDYDEKVQLTFNTGSLPDIVAKVRLQSDHIGSGLLLPIEDYEDRMPNYKAFIEKYGLRQALSNQRVDGKYYIFPVKATKFPIQAHNWMIRTDIFEKHNIPIPTTLEEMYEAGLQLLELYPDSVPITNRFQQGNMMTGLGAGFGNVAGWQFGTGMNYDFDSATWEFSPTTDGWRAMVEYTNKLLESGVMDAEWHTLDSVVYEQHVTQGNTFIMYDWSMNVVRYHNEGRKLDPDFQVNTIMPPMGPEGDYAIGWQQPWEQNWVISKEVADKPYFDEFLAVLDWFYTDEAEILMTFGKEGEMYTVEDGVHYRVDPENIDWFARAGVGNNCLNVRQHEDYMFAVLDDTDRAAFAEMSDKGVIPVPDPASPLNADEIEESGFKCVGLSDYVITSMMSFIEGQTPINDATWAEFVAGCEEKGSVWLAETYNMAEKRIDR